MAAPVFWVWHVSTQHDPVECGVRSGCFGKASRSSTAWEDSHPDACAQPRVGTVMPLESACGHGDSDYMHVSDQYNHVDAPAT